MKGKDDNKYQKLMELHKKARTMRDQTSLSRKALKAAIELALEGDVSNDVITAMQYL